MRVRIRAAGEPRCRRPEVDPRRRRLRREHRLERRVEGGDVASRDARRISLGARAPREPIAAAVPAGHLGSAAPRTSGAKT